MSTVGRPDAPVVDTTATAGSASDPCRDVRSPRSTTAISPSRWRSTRRSWRSSSPATPVRGSRTTLDGAWRPRTTPTSPCSSSTAGPTTTPPRGSPRTCRTRVVRRLGGDRRLRRRPRTRRCASVEGATFLLLCHDDVVPDPSDGAGPRRGGLPVERRDRGAEAGERRRPAACCSRSDAPSTGSASPYTGIEPGEFDQEQHDGVRDVFYVTTATMLVRVDLFTELGGFDPRPSRAPRTSISVGERRLAGARVLVAPGRAGVAPRGGRASARQGGPPRRSRARPGAACACCSPRTRCSHSLWLVPVGIVVGFVEALGDLFTGHPRRARASRRPAGSRTCSTCAGSVRPRKRAQPLRNVRDRELRELQIGSATRLDRVLRPPPADRRAPAFVRRPEPLRGRHDVGPDARPGRVRVRSGSSCVVIVGSRKLHHRRRARNRNARAVAGGRRPLRRVRLGVALHRSRLGIAGADRCSR